MHSRGGIVEAMSIGVRIKRVSKRREEGEREIIRPFNEGGVGKAFEVGERTGAELL